MSNAQYAAVMGGGAGGVNISTNGTAVSAAATNAALAHMPLPIATIVNTQPATSTITTQPSTSQQTMAARPSGKIAAMERAKAAAKAAKYTSIDDERRMKFLALLCGRGAFKGVSTNQQANVLLSRERSGSIGGMGGMSPHVNDGKNSSNNSHSIGKKQGSTIVNTTHTSQTTTTNEQNYQPTIPSALSRRILHKSGVGYLDNSVPLILSAMSDRFIATILVQAKACRDRRIEGYKATIKERKKRNKHRKLVLKERLNRDKRYKEELSKKRSMMESTVMDAKELLEKDNSKKGNSSSGGEDKTLFGLSEEEREAIKEYKKQAADVDAEEEYYNKYYGKAGGEDGNLDLDNISSDEEDEEDDELVVDTDLKLRDLVRPLGAWGFDLTGKLGFTDEGNDDSDGDEYELVDNANEDGAGSDEDDDEDQDDNVSYSDSSDMGTTDDDEGAGPKSPKKKKPPSPKKKSKAKKASGSGGGTKKSGTTTTKKKTAKRKRDESKDDASSKSSGDGKPKAKKAATAASKKTEAATADAKKK